MDLSTTLTNTNWSASCSTACLGQKTISRTPESQNERTTTDSRVNTPRRSQRHRHRSLGPSRQSPSPLGSGQAAGQRMPSVRLHFLPYLSDLADPVTWNPNTFVPLPTKTPSCPPPSPVVVSRFFELSR